MRVILRLRCTPQWLRALVPVLVFCAATGLLCVVPVGGAPLPSLLEAAYGALGLFAASPPGLPPAHPDLGSPMGWAALALWGVYFVAPGLVVTVLANALMTVLLAPARLVTACAGHTVILGMGAHGRVLRELALDAAGEDAGAWTVVTVDQSPAELGVQRGRGGRAWLSLRGDLHDPETLRNAAIHRAARVFISTGNATLNAAVARQICALPAHPAPAQLLVLTDEAEDADTLDAQPAKATQPWTSIPQYDEAAREMWRSAARRLQGQALPPNGPLRIVILGLGRFGRALLRVILEAQAHAEATPGQPGRRALDVLLVDPRHPGPGPALRQQARAAGARLTTCKEAAECWVDRLSTEAAAEPSAAAQLIPHFVFSTIDDDNTALMCKRWLDQIQDRWGAEHRVQVGLRLSWAPMQRGADPGDAALVCSVLDHFRARMQQVVMR